jgi:hypothetical protein
MLWGRIAFGMSVSGFCGGELSNAGIAQQMLSMRFL